ncbi:hypothetical protein [Rhizobium mongolense]|uniref:hypothetical protein n=1 Tax=Rhizobium mongolense TaxID=57676 RepID=UPI0034A39118
MRDEAVVYDRQKRDQQRKMLLRRGETPTSSNKPLADPQAKNFYSPLDVVGLARFAVEVAPDTLENGEPVRVGMAGHNGYRSVARNSKKSYRGFIIFNRRQVQHESRIEKNTAQIMLTWPDVVNIWSQRPRVKYPDHEGKWHWYVFDYLLHLRDGTYLAISVKPEKAREDEEAKLRQIVSVPQSDFDVAFVFTDRQATRTAAFNARFILWARKNANEEEMQAARELMWLGKSELFFWQLFDDGSPHHLRRAAIGRLIDTGELIPIDPFARITDYCRLKVST